MEQRDETTRLKIDFRNPKKRKWLKIHMNSDTREKKTKKVGDGLLLELPMEIIGQIFCHLGSKDWHACLFTLNYEFRDILMCPSIMAHVVWDIDIDSLSNFNYESHSSNDISTKNYMKILEKNGKYKISNYHLKYSISSDIMTSHVIFTLNYVLSRENRNSLVIEECLFKNVNILSNTKITKENRIVLNSSIDTIDIYNSYHSDGFRISDNIKYIYVDFLTLFQYDVNRTSDNKNFYYPDHECSMYIMNSKRSPEETKPFMYLYQIERCVRFICKNKKYIKLYLDTTILYDVIVEIVKIAIFSVGIPHREALSCLLTTLSNKENNIRLLHKQKLLEIPPESFGKKSGEFLDQLKDSLNSLVSSHEHIV